MLSGNFNLHVWLFVCVCMYVSTVPVMLTVYLFLHDLVNPISKFGGHAECPITQTHTHALASCEAICFSKHLHLV